MPILNLQLPEALYESLSTEARLVGRTVEEIAIGRLNDDPSGGSDLSESFFTPAILAEIDSAVTEANGGGGITLDEMRNELAERSQAWRANHPA